jgi:hypothetical protein
MSAPKRLRSSFRVEIRSSKAVTRKNKKHSNAVADEEVNGTGELAEGSDVDDEGGEIICIASYFVKKLSSWQTWQGPLGMVRR